MRASATRVGQFGPLGLLWECARMQVVASRGSPVLILLTVVQPVVFLLIVIGLRPVQSSRQAAELIVGVLLTAFWSSTVWTAGGILRWEAVQATLVRNLTSRYDARLIVVGKCLGSSSLALAGVVATAGAAALLLPTPVIPAHPVWAAAGLATVGVSGAATGLLLGSVLLLTRHGIHITSALMYPVFILGGLLIPLDLLPPPLRWPSTVISLSWAHDFLVSAVVGPLDLAPLGVALVLTIGYGLAGVIVLGRVVTRARRHGGLSLD